MKNSKQTFSERMEELREKAKEIKGGLDTLLTCKEAGNPKQVAYWVGKLSRDLTTLCQECLGEELLKKIKDRNIIT